VSERLIWLVLLCGMLFVATVSPAASAAGCYSDQVVYTPEPATIRAAADASGAFVRYTATGEGLYIINARRSSGSCWLQTNEGWLIYDPLVISDTFIGAHREATGAGQPLCLKGETATISGAMNIRESPTTSSPVVAIAQAGDTFTIIEKTVGVKWCWLKISLGWLAVTERVRASIPNRFLDARSIAPTTSAPSDIDNCCFVNRQCATDQEWEDGYWAYQRNECPGAVQTGPSASSRYPVRIEGSPKFVRGVESTLAVMQLKAPHWYEYVVGVADAIIEVHDEPDRFTCWAYVRAGSRNIWAEVCMFYPPYEYGRLSPIDGAAMLSHEACHLHGDDFVPATGEYDHDLCRKAARDAQAAIRGYTG